MSRVNAYQHKASDPDFAAAWQDALDRHADHLEEEATHLAHGVKEVVLYKGQMVTITVGPDGEPCLPDTPGAKEIPLVKRQYSETVLLRKLEALRPEVYGKKHQDTTQTAVVVNVNGVALSHGEPAEQRLESLLAMLRKSIAPSVATPALTAITSVTDTSSDANRS